MLEIIGKTIFVLLAIVGITDILRTFLYWMLQSHNSGKLYLIVSISGHEESAEAILESAIERLKWMRGEEKMLICLDQGMDAETRVVCKIIAKQNPGVEVCTPEELPNILNQ